MSYPFLRQGDTLPAVGVLQKLLNARVDSKLDPDGDFGPKTKAAVQKFQTGRLVADGVVGRLTWPRLVYDEAGLSVHDCVDVFDAALLRMEVADILAEGGNPTVIGGMSNGVEQAVTSILAAVPAGGVFILRFHGHGAPGNAGVSDGHGDIPGEHLSSIHSGNLDRVIPFVRRLRPIFSPYGCVQFMHCSTGRGKDGLKVLRAVADALGVPATAAVYDQLGGGLDTFRFEGPTRTVCPGGGSLAVWCRGRPDFVGRSVP